MIRHATKYDITELVEMVRQYASEFPSDLAKDPQWFDESYIKQVLMTMIAGRGFILVDDDYRGFIAAIVTPNTWYPRLSELCELAWWVKPEHRKATIGGKLWLMFDKEATAMKEEGRIHYIKTALTVNSPAIDYEKRGYKKLETAYLKE